jgi:trimeric autotransporter adhesin
VVSSKRFKEDIQPMDKVSEALYAFKPVSFRYRKAIDPNGAQQLGLVAEDVEKVSPNLIIRDTEGKPFTVRYDQVNAMLLNEFLKEHRKVETQESRLNEQETIIARLQKQIEALTAGVQKMSAQLATANGAAGMRSDIDGSSREANRSGSELVNPSLADLR